MPTIKTLSFRTQTVGGINDFLVDEGLTCAASQNLLAYLAGEFLAYKEEGVEISPEVLFCTSIERTTEQIPGVTVYKIGSTLLDQSAGKKILKSCATLAANGWNIFVERTEDNLLTYGVVSIPVLPGGISLNESLLINSKTLSVIIRRIGDKSISFEGATGSVLTCLFSTSRDTFQQDDDAAKKFARKCCESIGEDKKKEDFQEYFIKTISDLLDYSHGSIFACIDGRKLSRIRGLSDRIDLDPPVDLLSAYLDYKSGLSGSDLAAMQRVFALVRGMVQSDGIVVFDQQGRVLAFRTFYKTRSTKTASAQVDGGARRRAYEGVKTLIGNGVTGALFRSQDGQTLFSSVEEP